MELMSLPIGRFWFLLAEIPRLRAEDDLRQMQAVASAAGAESYKAAFESLQQQIGEVYVWVPLAGEIRIDPETGMDPEFDIEAYHAFKRRIQNQTRA